MSTSRAGHPNAVPKPLDSRFRGNDSVEIGDDDREIGNDGVEIKNGGVEICNVRRGIGGGGAIIAHFNRNANAP